jgi:chorismate mutase-like protein
LDILKPYRRKIDDLDRQIIDLLKQRYDVIREVGNLKAREGIQSFLQDRVDEVRENAAKMAAARGLDEDFIRTLYAQLIQHSCDLEEEIIQGLAGPGKKAANQ